MRHRLEDEFSQDTVMKERLNYRTTAPKAIEAFSHLQKYVEACGLEQSLL